MVHLIELMMKNKIIISIIILVVFLILVDNQLNKIIFHNKIEHNAPYSKSKESSIENGFYIGDFEGKDSLFTVDKIRNYVIDSIWIEYGNTPEIDLLFFETRKRNGRCYLFVNISSKDGSLINNRFKDFGLNVKFKNETFQIGAYSLGYSLNVNPIEVSDTMSIFIKDKVIDKFIDTLIYTANFPLPLESRNDLSRNIDQNYSPYVE